MALPTTKYLGTKQEFYWKELNLYALVSRVYEHSDGRITAEVSLKTDKPDSAKTHIIHTQLNLLSGRSKRELIRDAHNRYPLSEQQWTEIVEQLCEISLQNYRRGKPVKEIWPYEAEVPEAEMLIKPLIYQNKPTLIYGEGSTGKSYLALCFSIMTQLPYRDNSLWLTPKQANTLYLDYEADEEEFKRRLTYLCRGFDVGPVPILYRQCELPFVDDIDHLEELILEYSIHFLVIDSLGVALGNVSLNEAQAATSFFSALRRLRVTSLIISHTPKEDIRKLLPYGSIYFYNLARCAYLIQRQQEQESNEIAIDLIQTKNNQGPLLGHQGFRIQFIGDKTLVKRIEPETVPEFLERMTLKVKITRLLKEHGKLPIKEIAALLDKAENQVRAELSKHKDIFIKIDNKNWGLKAQPL